MPSMTYIQVPPCTCSVPCWVLQYALSSVIRPLLLLNLPPMPLFTRLLVRHSFAQRGRSFAFYRLTPSIGSEIFNTSKNACKYFRNTYENRHRHLSLVRNYQRSLILTNFNILLDAPRRFHLSSDFAPTKILCVGHVDIYS